MSQRINYRKLAFQHYDPICAHCGFGIRDVLEVAHIDCNRGNNDISNLVILCPNCHKMRDLNLISTETIIQMRDRPKGPCPKSRHEAQYLVFISEALLQLIDFLGKAALKK